MAILTDSSIRAVMLFALDPRAAVAWYAALHGVEDWRIIPGDGGELAYLEVNGVELSFHPADPDRNPHGGSPVVYWSVPSVSRARRHLLSRGATAHRGPLELNGDRTICQLVDPFGNVFGLDGPA